MKNIYRLLTGCILFLSAYTCPAQLVFMQGSFLKSDSNSYVVLNDLGLEHHTVPVRFDNVFKFTGGAHARVSGSTDIWCSKIQLAKQSGTRVVLDQDVVIEQSILFSGGLLDLNNKIVSLQPAALLLDENESSHVVGFNGGIVSIQLNMDTPSGANPGNLGAVISSSEHLGAVTIKRGHKMQSGFSLDHSINRYYDIEFAGGKSSAAKLRFAYFNTELNGQQSAAVRVYKSHDHGMHWNVQPNPVSSSGPDSYNRWTFATPGKAEENDSKNTSVLRAWPNPASGYFYVQARGK